MAELSTVARPYAEAAFDLANAAGAPDRWLDLLVRLAAVARDAQVVALLGDPKVGPEQLVELFRGVLPGEVEGELRGFLRVLAENGRIALLPEIAAQFRRLRNDARGSADARIESAFPLSDAERAELVAALERRFGRRLEATVTVNAELIGGVRVSVGDQVLDASVRGSLGRMAASLQS
jgi:F-type H+-transporting ATPase subunit delta